MPEAMKAGIAPPVSVGVLGVLVVVVGVVVVVVVVVGGVVDVTVPVEDVGVCGGVPPPPPFKASVTI